MEITKTHKMHLAVTKEATRYGTNTPWLQTTGDGPCVYATDGRIAVRVPVQTDETDDDGGIPSACFKPAIGTYDAKRRIDCNGSAVLHGRGGTRISHDRPDDDLRYPDADHHIDKALDSPNVVVGVNVAWLANLAKALGTDTVMLSIHAVDGHVVHPIGVTPTGDSASLARGVIMPITVKE